MKQRDINNLSKKDIILKKPWKISSLIGGVLLWTSVILAWCWNNIPEQSKVKFENWEPAFMEEKDGFKLYLWNPNSASRSLYVVVAPDGTSTTQWTVNHGKTSTTYNTVAIKGNINLDSTIENWLKLTPEQQESLWLPRSDNSRLKTIISLTQEQRQSLWLEQEYQSLISILKTKK